MRTHISFLIQHIVTIRRDRDRGRRRGRMRVRGRRRFQVLGFSAMLWMGGTGR
jgi:hypothetical protein